jgi:hypothetical protein
MNKLLSYFDGKRQLGKLRSTWKDNIKKCLKEIVGRTWTG